MYKKQITQTTIVTHRLSKIIGYSGLNYKEYATLTGITPGSVKNALYRCVAPRYDRFIRLLAGRYLPQEVLPQNDTARYTMLEELATLFVSHIQRVAVQRLNTGWRTWQEKEFCPSLERVEYVASGHVPALDFVVRLVVGGAISAQDLIPPLYENEAEDTYFRLLPNGLTVENTAKLFKEVQKLFVFSI